MLHRLNDERRYSFKGASRTFCADCLSNFAFSETLSFRLSGETDLSHRERNLCGHLDFYVHVLRSIFALFPQKEMIVYFPFYSPMLFTIIAALFNETSKHN